MPKLCNGCEFLNIDEYDQHLIKAKCGYYPPHICNKYNKRVIHFPYREPYIHPCEECEKGGEWVMTLNGCSKKLCPLQVGAADNCNLTKEQCPYFTQDIDYHRVLKQIKVEVAKEIFEEIERTLDNYHSACCPIGEIETYSYYEGDLGEAIAELKKKYTDCR